MSSATGSLPSCAVASPPQAVSSLTAERSRPAGNRAANVQVSKAGNISNSPTLIGASVENQLDAALWRLLNGEIGLQDLTPALRGWYTVAHDDGRASCRATIDKLTATADRLYMAAYGSKLKVAPNTPSYAELERRRGNVERAEQIERDLAAMFAAVNS
jgi:hypothetical protein